MAVLLVLWIFLGWRTTPAGRSRALWIVVGVLALCVRFIATRLILGNNGDSAGTDGLLYHKVATDVMAQLQQGIPLHRVSYSYTWYTLVLGVQYALFGANRYLGCFMNAFYAVAAAQVLLRIGLQQGFSMRKAMLLAGGWLFVPSLVVWTADTRKEGVSLLLAMLLWLLALMILKRRGVSGIVEWAGMLGVCALLWVSTVLRLYMLFPLGAGLLAMVLLRWAQTRRKALFLFFLLLFGTVLLFGVKTVLPQVDGNHALGVERTEGGDEDLSAEYRSVLHMLQQKDIPGAINGFFTEPHPGNIADISDLQGQGFAQAAVLAEMLVWYALMMLAVFGMMDATLRKDAFLVGMIVFVLLYSGVNILIAENISDTYYRYRAFIIAPVMLFADPRLMRRLLELRRTQSGARGEAVS